MTALSVVIPTHDTCGLTLRCLDAVAAWPRGEHEVIVVDDASADGTAAAVRERHPGVVLVVRARAGGFTRAVNEGLAAARGERLFLLNSDAEAPPATPGAILEAFAGRPRLGAAALPLVDEDGSPQWSAGRFPTPLWLFALASGLPGLLRRLPGYRLARRAARGVEVDWVPGAALALRREAWAAVGPLDEGYAFYAQDLDYCTRLSRAGWEVALLAGPPVRHRGGATIGRRPGAVGSAHPRLLWTDLARWAERNRAPAFAAAARRALRAGAGLRLAARRLATPLVPAGRRPGWRADTRAFAEAGQALLQRAPPSPGRGSSPGGP